MSSTNRGRRFPAEVLTDGEVQALLRGCNPKCFSGMRNRALIVVLYRSGLRVNEALNLRLVDVDPVAGTVRVLEGKGGHSRTVGLDAKAADVVVQWFAVRDAQQVKSRYLFCTRTGKRVHPGYVRHLMPRLARKAGIEKRVHPHGLRHTHAAQLAAEGVPVHVIQRQLGHSNLSTTSRYIDHLRPTEVIDAIRRRDW